jgi:anti-sigma regulatory factor (Ser/Thr protein kinase)
VTKAPDADVRLPIDQRQPGGLGLHLVRELLDSLEYEYSPADRQSRITFRKTVTEQSARGPAADGGPSGARE